jgi:molybdopterin converting factor small subunit
MRLVFLGKLRDVAGSSERDVKGHSTINDLLAHFQVTEPELHEALTQKSVRCALNLSLLPLAENAALADGDELAFMPAFSGG